MSVTPEAFWLSGAYGEYRAALWIPDQVRDDTPVSHCKTGTKHAQA